MQRPSGLLLKPIVPNLTCMKTGILNILPSVFWVARDVKSTSMNQKGRTRIHPEAFSSGPENTRGA